MPLKFELRENGHVLYTVATDPLNAEIMNDSIAEQIAYYDNAAGKLHQLTNVSHVTKVPSGILRMRRDSPVFDHPHRGLLIIVGANVYVRSVSEVVMRIARLNTVKFFGNELDAWAFIRKVIASEPTAKV